MPARLRDLINGSWAAAERTNSGRNEAIQWLRAIAAFEVMVWHSDLLAKEISAASIQSSAYRPLGGIGVELFFIVSGYLMGLVTQGRPNAKAFLIGRVRRLLPLYWAFTVLVIVVSLLNPHWRLGDFEWSGATLLRSFLLLPQDEFPILLVGWTLRYEVVFYVMVGLFIWLAGTRGSSVRIGFGLGLATLGLIGIAATDTTPLDPWMAHIANPYTFAFSCGWLIQSLPAGTPPGRLLAATILLSLYALALAFGDGHERFLLLRVALAAVMVAFVLALPRLVDASSGSARLVALVGEASYSIYLSHWFVMSLGGKLIGETTLPASADIAVRGLGITVAVITGTLFFLFVERPLDHRLKRMGVRQGVPPRALTWAGSPGGANVRRLAGDG